MRAFTRGLLVLLFMTLPVPLRAAGAQEFPTKSQGTPVYVPGGLSPAGHFWWIPCYSKGKECCVDSACSRTVSYQEFVRAKVLPEYRDTVRVFKVEDWTYGRKIIWIRREGK